MNRKNAILQAAVASALLVMAGASNAGTATATSIKYATQNFQATTTSNKAAQQALTIQANPLTYSMSSSTTVNTGGIIYFIVRLHGAKFTAAPAAGSFNVAAQGSGAITTVTLSADKTTVQAQFTATADTFLGLGALVFTPASSTINNVNDTLYSASGTVTAESTITTTAAANTTALDSTNALTSVDGAIPSVTLATAAAAYSVSAAADGEGQIDLTATPAASAYKTSGSTLTTAVSLGSVTITETAARKQQVDGATDFTVTAGGQNSTATSITITVTPPAGKPFPVGSTLDTSVTTSVAGTPACANLTGNATATLTATTAATAVSITVPVGTWPGTAAPLWVCLTAPSTGNLATPLTPTISAVVNPTSTTDLPGSVAATTGFALDYNGSQVDVRNYVPAAVTGWTTIVRVINTGTVAAKVSGAVIDETTGAVGTAGTLVTSLAAGAAATLNSTDIEAALGPIGSAARPRIRITAPTNTMDVQTYVFNPNGNFSIIHGKE
jgi:hypothetical protein